MTKKRIIIVDDEQAARQIIKEYIEEHSDKYEVIAECANGIEAVRDINTKNPDIVFLDIKMPGKNGFQVLNELNIIPQIVFSTAYDEFAIKAFELNAVDYLLKPLNKTRFEQTLKKLEFETNKAGLIALNNKVLDKKDYIDRIFIDAGNKLVNLNVNEIIYLKAEREYCKVFTPNAARLCSFGIGHMESVLDPQTFVRIHRSYIINIRFTSEIYKDIYKTFVRLDNDVELPVGRNYLERIKRFIF